MRYRRQWQRGVIPYPPTPARCRASRSADAGDGRFRGDPLPARTRRATQSAAVRADRKRSDGVGNQHPAARHPSVLSQGRAMESGLAGTDRPRGPRLHPERLSIAMTILIAEDNELNRELMRELLSAHGFTVLEARSGAEAIAMLSRHTPDLVLLDIQMPDGDGFWVLREIRAAAGLAGLP